MNLPAEWQQVLSSPSVIILLALVVVATLFIFLIPVILKVDFGQKARKSFQRNPKQALVLISLAVILAASGCLYYYFNQPVRIVSAGQFKLEKGRDIKQLQQRKPGSVQENKVAVVDIRSRAEYAVEHLKGSASLPAELVVKQKLKIDLDIAVYSSAARFEEARNVARAIRKNAKSNQAKYKVGKIYVIRDGFEGLKKAGLITESGGWD